MSVPQKRADVGKLGGERNLFRKTVSLINFRKSHEMLSQYH